MISFTVKRWIVGLLLVVAVGDARAQTVWGETRADQAYERYGVSGRGVVVVVIDRGINITNPDFRNPDGTTRVKYLLDMSQQVNWCNENPRPPVTEYNEQAINAALRAGTTIASRDAVGHGDATAGSAAGNGRAAAGGRYRGLAPEADLIIVKHTSEGAPAHSGQPAETGFVSCLDQALDWVNAKLDALGKPGVLIINSGTQFGPIDGTSAVSRKLAQAFPPNRPGRIVVLPGGDEGSLASHAGGSFSSTQPFEVRFRRNLSRSSVLSAWYDGNRPAEITVSLDNGETVGPIQPGASFFGDQVWIIQYQPGQEFYPWTSTSGDRAVWIRLFGYQGEGTVTFLGTGFGEGRVDTYSDVSGPGLTPITEFLDHLVPGRLTDYGSTRTAVIVGNYNLQTTWTDINGFPREVSDEGAPLDLWKKSPAGPTRDGRGHGIDITAPGQQSFVSTTKGTSYWSTLSGNLIQDGDGWYIRFGGTSGSTPIVVGAVARLLQLDPTLTTNDVRRILRASARTDMYTGSVPNVDWGWGKLDVNAALDHVACEAGLGLCLNQDRFLVRLKWRDFAGKVGEGQVVPFGSDDSGLLYFFDPDNWEMLVKVLDGCAINNRFWVFSAATTNVEYTLEVTDLVTGAVKQYSNPLGNAAAAITDTSAFATCSASAAATTPESLRQSTRSAERDPRASDSVVAGTGPSARVAPAAASSRVARSSAAGTCRSDGATLCLDQNRFQVEVSWKDFAGKVGSGQVVGFGSNDSGLFYFFDSDNWEMLVKVLDGCSFNNRYWVFSAATTNVEYTLKVTDTATGAVQQYVNPLGNAAAALTDTSAFATCS